MNARRNRGPRSVRSSAQIAALTSLMALSAPRAEAVDFNGTVTFEGATVFAAPIAGIDPDDLTVRPKSATEATGNGVKCSILATAGDNPDPDGTYPGGAGAVTANILVERGGPQLPTGACVVTIAATGDDGVSTSARGSRTILVDVNDVNANATVQVDDITVRASHAVAGVASECFSWFKKQLRMRRVCNKLLLQLGAAGAARCKDAGPEPADCDPGNHLEAILALSHGGNDQQVDPPSAEAVDKSMLADQMRCQTKLAAAAMRFSFKRIKKVLSTCVSPADDSETCRDQAGRDSRLPLNAIDRCTTDQLVDGGTGALVPDLGESCDICFQAGQLDRKCAKDCIELAVGDLTDGFIGDIAVCGNGIVQPGEFCDDGNLSNGDGCSDSCTVEP